VFFFIWKCGVVVVFILYWGGWVRWDVVVGHACLMLLLQKSDCRLLVDGVLSC
jgi:hypothetical protein